MAKEVALYGIFRNAELKIIANSLEQYAGASGKLIEQETVFVLDHKNFECSLESYESGKDQVYYFSGRYLGGLETNLSQLKKLAEQLEKDTVFYKIDYQEEENDEPIGKERTIQYPNFK